MPLLSLLAPAALAGDCALLDPWLVQLDAEAECQSVTLGALRELAAHHDLGDCLALELGHRGLPMPSLAEPALTPRPPTPDKLLRDPYNLYNAEESENFVIRWGEGISDVAARRMLVAFEESWEKEIVQMAYPVPRGADTYKFNVYVADSSETAPESYNAPAYQSRDPEGYPMIVMNAELIDYERGHSTAAHEFFHAVQDGINTYTYTGAGAWYFEATAVWAEAEVYPGDTDYADSLFGYAFLPWRSIDYFKAASSTEWELSNYHQYGAFIWPRFLTEHHVDDDLIKESWLQGRGTNNPLHLTGDLLESTYGLDIKELFWEFAARNAVWDYEHINAYTANVANREDDYISDRILRVVERTTDGWATITGDKRPERFGTNNILLTQLYGQDLHIGFRGDAEGDMGSAAEWNVQLVQAQGIHGIYTTVPLVDGEADVWLEGMANPDAGELWLVISVISEDRVPREQFGYSFLVETDYEPEAEDSDPVDIVDGGRKDFEEGRCSSVPAQSGLGAALLGLALVLRRRR